MTSNQRPNCSDRVRASCASVCVASKHVHINIPEVKHLAQVWRTTPGKLAEMTRDFADRLASPLNFDDIDEEINYSFVSNMLQFGSGFREELTKLSKRGASDTIMYGMLGLHMQYAPLTADKLSSISRADVATLFDISVDEEYEISPGIRSYRPSALAPLVNSLWAVLQQAAANLRSRSFADFATFMRRTLEAQPSAQHLLSEIIATFPNIFGDTSRIAFPLPQSSEAKPQENSGEGADTKPDSSEKRMVNLDCHIYKKAQLIVSDLYSRFYEREPRYFAFSDWETAPLTIFADNVIPTVLCSMGLISFSPRVLKFINNAEDMTFSMACHIRAAAVTATELLLNELNAEHKTESESESKASTPHSNPDESKTQTVANDSEPTTTKTPTKTQDTAESTDAAKPEESSESKSSEESAEVKKGSRALKNTQEFKSDYSEEEIDVISALLSTPSPNRTRFSGPELDHALWRLGKTDRSIRETKRLVCKNTVFF